MKRFVKKENGITLIALIITIIVMLILVGVTINVALNGGLFEKANNAASGTQRQADKEYLLSLITGTLSNTGDLQITAGNLAKEEWTAEETTNENYLKCTSPKDEVFYVNIETGEILDNLPEPVVQTNPWITRGLTSPNVVFDEIYTSEGGAQLAVCSDGSVNMNGNIITSEQVDATISAGNAFIGTDYWLLHGGYYLCYIYNNDNTMTSYGAPNSEALTKEAIIAASEMPIPMTISSGN